MARKNEAKIVLTADNKATPELQAVNVSLGDMAKAGVAAGLAMKAVDIATQAATKAFEALKNTVKEAVEFSLKQERAEIKIAAALRRRGKLTEDMIDLHVEMAEALEKEVGVSRDLIKESQAMILTFTTLNTDSIPTAIRLAADWSRVTGKGMVDAAKDITKAINGDVGALKEYGFTIDETIAKSGDVTRIFRELTKVIGGTAGADANTYSGAVTRLKLAWEGTSEAIGDSIIESNKLIGTLNVLTKFVNDMGDMEFGVMLGDFVAFGIKMVAQLASFMLQVQIKISTTLTKVAVSLAELQDVLRDWLVDQHKFFITVERAMRPFNKTLADAAENTSKIFFVAAAGTGKAIERTLDFAKGQVALAETLQKTKFEVDKLVDSLDKLEGGRRKLSKSAAGGAPSTPLDIFEGIGTLDELFESLLGKDTTGSAGGGRTKTSASRLSERAGGLIGSAIQKTVDDARNLQQEMLTLGISAGFALMQGIKQGIEGGQDVLRSVLKSILPLLGTAIGLAVPGASAFTGALGGQIGGGLAGLLHTGSAGFAGQAHTGVGLRSDESFKVLNDEMVLNRQAVQALGGEGRVMAAQAGIGGGGGGDIYISAIDTQSIRDALRRGNLGSELVTAVNNRRGQLREAF